ncbi:unnamed protein product [Thelazia callipaeda]|uniref:Proteasome assembly chaperone 1 n=1 Tax=Thelazia callipaeda TaxID=103827 RepID=A0A0N5D8G8_THECL|nr:unnamed protein product [Thelazia callipaeda]
MSGEDTESAQELAETSSLQPSTDDSSLSLQNSQRFILPWSVRANSLVLISESSLLFGGRKARYLPLAFTSESEIIENPCRVVMLGDYASGISLLRIELMQLISPKDIPFSNNGCCKMTTEEGYEVQLWLFISMQDFELFCQQSNETIHCCIACYTPAIPQTYRSVIEKWIPEFLNKYADKPVILCALGDSNGCDIDNGETLFMNSFCDNNLIHMDISFFDKVNSIGITVLRSL